MHYLRRTRTDALPELSGCRAANDLGIDSHTRTSLASKWPVDVGDDRRDGGRRQRPGAGLSDQRGDRQRTPGRVRFHPDGTAQPRSARRPKRPRRGTDLLDHRDVHEHLAAQRQRSSDRSSAARQAVKARLHRVRKPRYTRGVLTAVQRARKESRVHDVRQGAAHRTAALFLAFCILVAGAAAQTVVKPPKNRYTPQQDVRARSRGRGRGSKAVSRSSRTRGSPATSPSSAIGSWPSPRRAEGTGLSSTRSRR